MEKVIRRRALEVFLYLQVLDIMSTLIGFSLGNAEASPFIRLLVRWGPVTGLAQPSQFSRSEAGMPFIFSKSTAKVSTTF